jgi:hypothetical protein
MNGTRTARNISAAVVATIAAWSSYRHMVHVALHVGEQPSIAWVLPLSVDGLLVVASIAMVDDRQAGRTVRWSARIAFAFGIVASLAANVAAAHPTVGARMVAAWPALALLLTVELLSRSGRPRARPRVGQVAPTSPGMPAVAAPSVRQVAEVVEDPRAVAFREALRRKRPVTVE